MTSIFTPLPKAEPNLRLSEVLVIPTLKQVMPLNSNFNKYRVAGIVAISGLICKRSINPVLPLSS